MAIKSSTINFCIEGETSEAADFLIDARDSNGEVERTLKIGTLDKDTAKGIVQKLITYFQLDKEQL